MKQQLIEQAQKEIQELLKKQDAAKRKLANKRKQLSKEVNDDAVDLFGDRKTDSPEKLFNPAIDPTAVNKALEPFRAEIAGYQKELDKWRKDLLRLQNMTESDLFSESQKVA